MPALPGADDSAYIVSFLPRILRSPSRTAPEGGREAELRGLWPRSRHLFGVDETRRKECEEGEVIPCCCSRQTAARLSAYRNIDSVVVGLATAPSWLRWAHEFPRWECPMLEQEAHERSIHCERPWSPAGASSSELTGEWRGGDWLVTDKPRYAFAWGGTGQLQDKSSGRSQIFFGRSIPQPLGIATVPPSCLRLQRSSSRRIPLDASLIAESEFPGRTQPAHNVGRDRLADYQP